MGFGSSEDYKQELEVSRKENERLRVALAGAEAPRPKHFETGSIWSDSADPGTSVVAVAAWMALLLRVRAVQMNRPGMGRGRNRIGVALGR